MANLIYSILPKPRRPIAYIDPAFTVMDCVNLMVDKDIGALVVHDRNELIGLVSERDIVRTCLHQGLDPHIATAADIVYKNVSILDVNDTVEKAMEIITMTKRRHVLINEDGKLVAIISIGDVLFSLIEDKSRLIEHLEAYIHS
ncbi:CBS domain protein [Legionella busanensis]|uniref:CBS domain protein n=1 Tax=Legionella busanensis TaxID=190655 RepID=A0A378JKC5_9GAMM|nr:CBS domain-containing protein [Legionella busanensis]STX51191.1 CBS domain protein [Legionella busanensis]